MMSEIRSQVSPVGPPSPYPDGHLECGREQSRGQVCGSKQRVLRRKANGGLGIYCAQCGRWFGDPPPEPKRKRRAT